jgi:hypothetical protein
MPVFSSSSQLYSLLQQLFNKIKEDPNAVHSVASSRLVIRLMVSSPEAVVTIDGRGNPVKVDYGSSTGRADLEVSLSADSLHQILQSELSLRKALAGGQMKVRGPVWKTFALQEILQRGRALYPEIYRASPGSV